MLCLFASTLSYAAVDTPSTPDLNTSNHSETPPAEENYNPTRKLRLGPDFGYVLGSNATRVRSQGTVGAQILFPTAANGVSTGVVYQYGWNSGTNYALAGFSISYYFWNKAPGAYFGGEVGLTDSHAENALKFWGEYFLDLKAGYEVAVSKKVTSGIEFKKCFRDTNPIAPVQDTDIYFNALLAYFRFAI